MWKNENYFYVSAIGRLQMMKSFFFLALIICCIQ